jgi:hypothetical protein
MHFSFNLLRIKGFYVFRALLAYSQEALHKRHLVRACVLCQLAATRVGVELQLSLDYIDLFNSTSG